LTNNLKVYFNME